MSSKIVRGNSTAVETLPWRRAGEPESPPLPPEPEPPGVDAELDRYRAVIAGLEGRLTAAVRAADEREAQALEAGRTDAYRAGFLEGAAVTQAEANRVVASLQAEAAESAAGAAAQAVDLRRRLREQMEADLVRLAIAVARRVLRRELSVDPDALLGIVKAAVGRIAARELLAIRVAPSDAPRVAARLGALLLPDRVEVVADSALTSGSVVFDTTRGQYDASVDTQIEEIDRGLADLVGRPE